MRGRYGQVFNISTIRRNTDGSFEATVSWTPLTSDIGPRIVCASAVDSAGYVTTLHVLCLGILFKYIKFLTLQT